MLGLNMTLGLGPAAVMSSEGLTAGLNDGPGGLHEPEYVRE